MARKCQECNTEFFGRVDKKFCSDQCRNSYNNKLNGNANNYMRNVNNVLRRNRRILEKLNPRGKSKASREELLSQGFDFDYYTNVYQTKAGKVYYFCYEQGYLPLEEEQYALVIKQDYV